MEGFPTHLLVDSVKIACNAKAIPFMVRQKGDASRGTMLVCLVNLKGQARVYTQERDLDFVLSWRAGDLISEAEAEAIIQLALKGDPDQWVIEIENPAMIFPFEGPKL